MPVSGDGRHCAACSRTLTDFSGLSDTEVLSFLKKHPGSCGRFAAGQLNRLLHFPAAPHRAQSFPKWVAGALLVVATQSAAAQEQLSPELPGCDDSLAVELRMDGYVPLPESILARADSLAMVDSSRGDSLASAQHCRQMRLDSLVARFRQDSAAAMIRFETLVSDSMYTMGFAVMDVVDGPGVHIWMPETEKPVVAEKPRTVYAVDTPVSISVPEPAREPVPAPRIAYEAILPKHPEVDQTEDAIE